MHKTEEFQGLAGLTCACTCIQLHRSHVYSFAVAHALSWRSLVAGYVRRITRNATALSGAQPTRSKNPRSLPVGRYYH